MPPAKNRRLLTPEFKREIAEDLVNARVARQAKLNKADPGENQYFLELLAEFDAAIRPQVDVKAVVHGNFKYTPIQMYEILFSYLHTCIKLNRNMTISHMGWYTGIDRDDLSDIGKGNCKEPAYRFVKYFIDFITGQIEYRAQDKVNPAFHIFWLKQRGWKDKQEIELSATKGAMTDAERTEAQRRIAEFSEVKGLPAPPLDVSSEFEVRDGINDTETPS